MKTNIIIIVVMLKLCLKKAKFYPPVLVFFVYIKISLTRKSPRSYTRQTDRHTHTGEGERWVCVNPIYLILGRGIPALDALP